MMKVETMAPVPAVLTQTLPEKIAAALAELVISGHYQPSERLIESALVKGFNVSHGPVRDALRILQNSGLVTIHPYRGAQVTELTVREVKGNNPLRITIDKFLRVPTNFHFFDKSNIYIITKFTTIRTFCPF